MNTLPLPRANPDSQAFWEGTACDELRYQRCTQCHHAQFPPRAHCLRCEGATEWAVSRGTGVVHSFTRVERAPSAAFKALVPYVIVLAEMDEGFRLMLNLHAEAPDELIIGARIRVTFEATAERGLKLPQAVPI